jgi:hypothetical protein
MLYEMAFRQKLFDSDFALLEYIYTKRNPATERLDQPAEETTRTYTRGRGAPGWQSRSVSMEDPQAVAIDSLTGSQEPDTCLTGIDPR